MRHREQCRRMALAAMLIFAAVSWPGCGDSEEPPAATERGRAEPAEKKPTANVTLIEVHERNSDGFAEPLAVHGDLRAAAPFALIDDAVHLAGEVARQTDPAALAAYNLVLGDRAVPLADCGVLVIYEISYDGVGRDGSTYTYYASTALPAAVPIGPAFAGKAFEFDPATATVPFLIALKRVRLLPPGVKEIAIAAAGPGKIRVTAGPESQELAAGETAKLGETAADLPVSERALTKDQVTWADGPPPANLPDQIRPPRDHGRVRFSTTLEVRYAGTFPIAHPETPEEALK